MPAVCISVNVHIGTDTALRLHRTGGRDRVWLEVGDPDSSVALFLDLPGLHRLAAVLAEAEIVSSTSYLTAA